MDQLDNIMKQHRSTQLIPQSVLNRQSLLLQSTQSTQSSVPTIYSIILFTSMMILQVLLSRLPVITNNESLQRYELRRKLQHLFTLSILLYCYLYYINTITAIILMSSACVFMYALHKIRLVNPDVQRYLLKLFSGLIRPNERYCIPGSFYCLLGLLINMTLYNTSTTAIALVCIAYGDVAASLCGKYSTRYIRYRKPSKTMEGSIAMFTVCVISTYFMYAFILRSGNVIHHNGLLLNDHEYVYKSSPAKLMTYSVISSLAATITERHSQYVDDNLTIQLVTAAVLAILQCIS